MYIWLKQESLIRVVIVGGVVYKLVTLVWTYQRIRGSSPGLATAISDNLYVGI